MGTYYTKPEDVVEGRVGKEILPTKGFHHAMTLLGANERLYALVLNGNDAPRLRWMCHAGDYNEVIQSKTVLRFYAIPKDEHERNTEIDSP